MQSQLPAVGIIGVGIMGSAMAGNLLKAGFPLWGCDLDSARTQALRELGGNVAASPQEVAQHCDCILTSLPSAAALRDVISGPRGLLAGARRGIVVSECSTLPIEEKEQAQAALAAAGVALLDSPLSGTGSQAVRKDLLVYSSGERAAYERMVPIYAGFSRGSHFLGAFGNGSRMKFIANLLVSIHNVAAAEAMVLGMKAGMDPAEVYKVISDGAGTSRMFDLRGASMVTGTYDPPMMKMDMWLKDLSIIGKFAADLHCPTPLFTASSQYYQAAVAQGRAGQDTAAVCAVLETLAGEPREAAPLATPAGVHRQGKGR